MSRKVLETATRSKKNMKPLWKIKGFEKQTYHTNRHTKSHSDAQDKQTHGHGHGHGHDAAQHKNTQENKIDTETQKPV